MKHVGKIANTGQRCVVVMMQVPGNETNALVVPVNSLHKRTEQAVMEIVQSHEGQGSDNLADVLNRRQMPGEKRTILKLLHDEERLRVESVENVIMVPKPNLEFPLTKVLEAIGKAAPPADRAEVFEPTSFNHHLVNINADDVEKNRIIARNLMMEALGLEHEALKKREKAYMYDPSLRPPSMPIVAPQGTDHSADVADAAEIVG